jgi:hypothetical protein
MTDALQLFNQNKVIQMPNSAIIGQLNSDW